MKPIRILSGGAAQGLVEALRVAFKGRTGCDIDGTFGAVGAMKARLLAGEPADVMILSRALIDELVDDGHVVASSVTDIGSVQTAIAVRRGDSLPAVGDATQLLAALDAADEIHFPDPEKATAGIHFAQIMKQLGIAAADRSRPQPNGAMAMRALAASTGRKPIGCTQATEILATPGLTLVGPLPPGCDLATVYSGAVTAGGRRRAEATALVRLLADETSRKLRRQLGFL